MSCIHAFGRAILPLLLVVSALQSTAATVYVRKGAAGSNTGQNWADAYPDPTSAFQTASAGDEVWIAKGTYHPGLPGQTSASFHLPSGVRVYGGFSGTETKRDQRDWKANETVFSGDLGDDDVFGNPWYTNWNTNTPNSLRVLSVVGASSETLLDGIVVSNGNAIQSTGGGVYSEASQLDLRHCTFRRNSGYSGGGSCVFAAGGFLRAFDCRFVENWGRFVSGVGIMTSGTAGAEVSRCLFYDNHAEANASQGNGAGIEFNGSSPSRVVLCEFRANVSLPFYSSYPSYGGGIHNFGAPLTVDRCTFDGNTCVNGGGIWSWKDLTVTNSLFKNNRVYAGINGGGFGGAVATYSYQPYALTITGCTIVNNQAHETAGVWYGAYAAFTSDIANCVFWGNRDINGTVSQTSVKKASNNCVENLWITIPGEDPIDPEKFPGCIDSDPQFVTSQTDFRLRLSSPCVDAGDKTKFGAAWTLDLDSMSRFFDIATAPDTGIGGTPLPDMGCYEAADGRRLGQAQTIRPTLPR